MQSLILFILILIGKYSTLGKSLEDPLFLTSFIDSNQLDLAREKALVKHGEIKVIKSYSGFITVDKRYNSNTFFWFFPSQTNPETDPIMLWFQGNMGQTASIPIFLYNGPFAVKKSGELIIKDYSFITNHSVIYIDNPVGTGYSFTEDDKGYARGQDDVGRDVVEFLKQFFTIFSDFHKNDFFIGGDSNGGKYATTATRAVKQCNCSIKVKGVILGNPYIDHVVTIRADYMFALGLVSEAQRDSMLEIERELIRWRTDTFYKENGTTVKYTDPEMVPSTWELVPPFTGLEQPLNILDDVRPEFNEESKYYERWMDRADTRVALHVGNLSYIPFSGIVKKKLAYDIYVPVTPALEDLLESHSILLYNGQLDMLFPYQSIMDLVKSLRWSAVDEFKKATRKIWYVDGKIAGYARTAGNLIELMVRNAGHVVTNDQLHRACKMLTSYTRGRLIKDDFH